MSSSPVRLRSKYQGSKPRPPLAGGIGTPGYSASPGSYVVLSPVLVPYVQAPVRYVKCKPKKGSEKILSSPAKVRYVPAYTCTTIQPQFVYYNKQRSTPLPVANVGVPYAMTINKNAAGISQGYVSALTQTSAYIEQLDGSSASHSILNPLSRPYTPPSRMTKQLNCKQNADSIEEMFCSSRPTSGRSSPNLSCDDSMSDVASRGPTPFEGTCPCCRRVKCSHLSDADSGVEGESDEETWCCCYRSPNSNASRTSPALKKEKEEEYPDLLSDLCKLKQSELSQPSSDLVDFLCSHLASHEWRTVARELGVSDVTIQSVEYDVYDSFREEMRYVFSFWIRSQESKSHEENCRQMEKAFVEIGRADLVGELSSHKTV